MEIYGTLGPACMNAECLYKMIQNGMTGIRVNLSHAMLADMKEGLENLHRAERMLIKDIDIMADIEGPELRILAFEGKILLNEGYKVKFTSELCESYTNEIPVPAELLPYIDKETNILLDDGKIELLREGDYFKVVRGGVLLSKKSIKLVNVEVKKETLTVNDLKNISAFKAHNVTKVMLPFVRDAEDVKTLRNALDTADCKDVKIYAKIENATGLENLDAIMQEADVIVIARGDLGNAYGLIELPIVQDKISEKCRKAGKEFLVVTQMLDSMLDKKIPTRAETSDIFRAVKDGATALMLTNETSVGKYPTESMKMMCDVAMAAEKYCRG